jgi:hypothetical protein
MSYQAHDGLYVKRSTNQIVLGADGGTKTTLSSTAPSVNRTITIPDAGLDSNVVLTEGNQTINGTKTFTALSVSGVSANTLTLAGTTNQLTMGTTNTTTINSTAPTVSRIYTLGDAGTDANFVMSEGTQTINGAKTFSGSLVAGTTDVVTELTSIETNKFNTDYYYVLPDGGTVSSQNLVTPKVYTSIQSAITAANSAGGGTVQLLEGTYTVSSQIQFYSNTIIQGEGYGTNVYVNLATSTSYTGTTCTNALFYGQEVSGVTFRDFKITTPSSSYTIATGIFVVLGNCSDVYIEDMTILAYKNDSGSGSGSYVVIGNDGSNSTLTNCVIRRNYITSCRACNFNGILTNCAFTDNTYVVSTANANTYGLWSVRVGNGTSQTTSTCSISRNRYSLLSGTTSPRGGSIITATSSTNRYSSIQLDISNNVFESGLAIYSYYYNYVIDTNSNLDILNSKIIFTDNTFYNSSSFAIALFRGDTNAGFGGYYVFRNNTVLPTSTTASNKFRWCYNDNLMIGATAVTFYLDIFNTNFTSHDALYYTTTSGVTNVPTFISDHQSDILTLSAPTNQLQFVSYEPNIYSASATNYYTKVNTSRATATSRVITMQDYCEDGTLLMSSSNGDMSNKSDVYMNNGITIGDFDNPAFTKTTNYECDYSLHNLSTSSYTYSGTEKQALVWSSATSNYNVTLTGTNTVFQLVAGIYQVDWKIKLGSDSTGSIDMIVSIESSSDGSTWSGTDIKQFYGGLKQWYSGNNVESSFLIDATTNTYWRLMLATGLATTVSLSTGTGGSYIFIKNTKEYGDATSVACFTQSTTSIATGSNRSISYTTTATISDPTSIIPSPSTPTTTQCWTLSAGTYMIDVQHTTTQTTAGGILCRFRVDSETGFGAPFYSRDHTFNYETPANINPQSFHWRDIIQVDSTYKYLNIAMYVGMYTTFNATAPLSFINIQKISDVAGVYGASASNSYTLSTTTPITNWTAQTLLTSQSSFGGKYSNGIFCFEKLGIYNFWVQLDGDTDFSAQTTPNPTMSLTLQYSSDNTTWTDFATDTFKQTWYVITAIGGDVSSGMWTNFTVVASNSTRFWRFKFTNGSSLLNMTLGGTTTSVYVKPYVYFSSLNIASATLHGDTSIKSGSLSISDTTNQLVLGTTNTTTINSSAPASNRTYTIPDTSTSTANFVMTEGNQTINGTKTFTALSVSGISTNTLTLAGTTNQLTMGTTNTTTLNSTAPTASRIYTIPDAGMDANFVMTEATTSQIIGGGVTLSNSSNQLGLKHSSHTGYINSSALTTDGIVYSIPDSSANTDFMMTGVSQTVSGTKTFQPSTATTTNPLVVKSASTTTETILYAKDSSGNDTSRINFQTPNNYNNAMLFQIYNTSLLAWRNQVQLYNSGVAIGTTQTSPPSEALVVGGNIKTEGTLILKPSPYTYGVTVSATAPVADRTYTIPDTSTSTANFVMSESSQTINGSKTFGSAITAPSETLTATTNQLVLGTTNTTTISSTAPTASRVYTIPDAGANANFVMSEGTQTINGSKTFGSSITAPSETLTATSNQLVLGTTYTSTISATQPNASRVNTIPALYTNSSFSMSQLGTSGTYRGITREVIMIKAGASFTVSTYLFYPLKNSSANTYLAYGTGSAIGGTETSSSSSTIDSSSIVLAVENCYLASPNTQGTSLKVAVSDVTLDGTKPYVSFSVPASKALTYHVIFTLLVYRNTTTW